MKFELVVVFILRRMLEEYHAKGKKLHMRFWFWESFRQSTKVSVGMGNEEDINTRSFC